MRDFAAPHSCLNYQVVLQVQNSLGKATNGRAGDNQPLTPPLGERTQHFVYRPFEDVAECVFRERGVDRVGALRGDRDRYSL